MFNNLNLVNYNKKLWRLPIESPQGPGVSPSTVHEAGTLRDQASDQNKNQD